MGFFDSLKTGLGRIGSIIGDVVEFAAPLILPPLIQAGTQALVSKIGGGQPGQFQRIPQPIFSLPGGASTRLGVPQARIPAGAGPPFMGPGPFGPFTGGGPFFPSAGGMQRPSPSPFPLGSGTRSAPGTGGFQLASFPATRAGFELPSFGLPFIDIVPQGQGALQSIAQPFVATRAGARAVTHVMPNPATGQATWFRPAGRPILFSGDLAVCRRVDKLARRARTARRGRR